MTSKPESRLQRRIQDALKREFPGCVFYKIHGNEFQVAGIPDLIGCVNGLFFAFEVKMLKGTSKISKAQQYEIERIKLAGGKACVVMSALGAIDVVRTALGRAKTGR